MSSLTTFPFQFPLRQPEPHPTPSVRETREMFHSQSRVECGLRSTVRRGRAKEGRYRCPSFTHAPDVHLSFPHRARPAPRASCTIPPALLAPLPPPPATQLPPPPRRGALLHPRPPPRRPWLAAYPLAPEARSLWPTARPVAEWGKAPKPHSLVRRRAVRFVSWLVRVLRVARCALASERSSRTGPRPTFDSGASRRERRVARDS